MLYDRPTKLADQLIHMLNTYDIEARSNEWHKNHYNYFWSTDKVELAHVSVIDMREEKGMWMMHVACFARAEYPMPIYGFDIICGKKKITGCFHDMSPTVGDSTAIDKFKETVYGFMPTRTRELPQWAKEIFSQSMVVAGNIKSDEEVEKLCYFGLRNLSHWMDEIETKEEETDPDIIAIHQIAKAKYCKNQLMNTNSNNVMVALGLDEDYVKDFKQKTQFPF